MFPFVFRNLSLYGGLESDHRLQILRIPRVERVLLRQLLAPADDVEVLEPHVLPVAIAELDVAAPRDRSVCLLPYDTVLQPPCPRIRHLDLNVAVYAYPLGSDGPVVDGRMPLLEHRALGLLVHLRRHRLALVRRRMALLEPRRHTVGIVPAHASGP